MFGGNNAYTYFDSHFLFTESNIAYTFKTELYAQTTTKNCAKKYNDFYQALLVQFNITSNYTKSVYQSRILAIAKSIHENIKCQFYLIDGDRTISDSDKLSMIQDMIYASSIANLDEVVYQHGTQEATQTYWDQTLM